MFLRHRMMENKGVFGRTTPKMARGRRRSVQYFTPCEKVLLTPIDVTTAVRSHVRNERNIQFLRWTEASVGNIHSQGTHGIA